MIHPTEHNTDFSRHMTNMTILEKESIEIEAKIATEAPTNIRTIASLSEKNNLNII